MVKHILLALPFAALLNCVLVVSGSFLPIFPILENIVDGTTVTIANGFTGAPATTPSSTIAATTTLTSQTTTSPTTGLTTTVTTAETDSSSANVVRYLTNRQVHNADYAANSYNTAADSNYATTSASTPAHAAEESSNAHTAHAEPSAARDEKKRDVDDVEKRQAGLGLAPSVQTPHVA